MGLSPILAVACLAGCHAAANVADPPPRATRPAAPVDAGPERSAAPRSAAAPVVADVPDRPDAPAPVPDGGPQPPTPCDDPPAPRRFEDCERHEITASPPCEIVCVDVRTGPEPRLRTIARNTLYVRRGTGWRAVFSWTSYDGPLDPVSREDSAAHTRAHWDQSSSPPTLVLPEARYRWSRGAMRRVRP